MTKQGKAKIVQSQDSIPEESVDVVLAECPLKYNWYLEGGHRRMIQNVEPLMKEGAFLVATVGHKTIMYLGEELEPLKVLHTLVVKRKPEARRTVVGLSISSTSILNVLAYKRPYRVPEQTIFDLPAFSDEIENPTELSYHRLIQPLLPKGGVLLHWIGSDKTLNIEDSLKHSVELAGGKQYIQHIFHTRE